MATSRPISEQRRAGSSSGSTACGDTGQRIVRREARARFDRVRRDYQDGRLDADDWRDQKNQLQDELEAAQSALAALRAREERIREEGNLRDAQSDALNALVDIRAAVSGRLSDRDDLASARNALKHVFKEFRLHWRDRPVSIADGELARWWIEVVPHEDMILRAPQCPSGKESLGYLMGQGELSRVPVLVTDRLTVAKPRPRSSSALGGSPRRRTHSCRGGR